MDRVTTENYADWYALWMKQSQMFFESANAHFQHWFNQAETFRPEEHREQVNEWLASLRNQWENMPLTVEQKKYSHYWSNMTQMFNEAYNKMSNEWIGVSMAGNPVRNIRELYELWINCCHESYAKSLRNPSFQDAYADFMAQAFKFWKGYSHTQQ